MLHFDIHICHSIPLTCKPQNLFSDNHLIINISLYIALSSWYGEPIIRSFDLIGYVIIVYSL